MLHFVTETYNVNKLLRVRITNQRSSLNSLKLGKQYLAGFYFHDLNRQIRIKDSCVLNLVLFFKKSELSKNYS